MSLRGQAAAGDKGYAMAALLVAMAVMAVLMSVALPVWRHEAQREKEEELVFRGQQYIRAIRLFHQRTQTLPTSVDMLVQGRYLRKKYKDPVSGEDFNPIPAGGAIPGQGGGRAGQPAQGGQPGRGGMSPAGGFGSGTSSGPPTSTGFGGTIPGGMMGVVSKSKEQSIRLYQGRNHYNEWTFLYVMQAPGGPGGPGGRGQPGGPGGRGGPQGPQRGGRGVPDGRGIFPGGGFPGGGGFDPGRGGRGAPVPGRGGVPVGPGRGGRLGAGS